MGTTNHTDIKSMHTHWGVIGCRMEDEDAVTVVRMAVAAGGSYAAGGMRTL